MAMQHVEFFNLDHFENNYYRIAPSDELKPFIDFFWQTKFEHLWAQYPNGFSDALFPNIGYTYLINLGTAFIMQVGEKKFSMKADGFLPRHKAIRCHHQAGNILFGIKFKISPLIFQKKVNFSEYKEAIFPLSYLIEQKITESLKEEKSFDERVDILNKYFSSLLNNVAGYTEPINIVSSVLKQCSDNGYTISIEDIAREKGISARTLQRYFEITTSLSSKKTLQILKIRKAVEELVNHPENFHYSKYGYYDNSHFYKHLKSFLTKEGLQRLQQVQKKER
jgi:AraC-like DNA-binding protein